MDKNDENTNVQKRRKMLEPEKLKIQYEQKNTKRKMSKKWEKDKRRKQMPATKKRDKKWENTK